MAYEFYFIRDKVTKEIRTYNNFEKPRPPVLYPSVSAARRWLIEERRRVNRLRQSYEDTYKPSWLPRPFKMEEWEIVQVNMLEMKYMPA